MARGEAFHALGRLSDASDELSSALQVLPKSANEIRLDAMRAMWNTGVFRQSSALIRQVGDEAMQLAHAVGRDDLAAEAQCALALADHCDARIDEAMDGLRRSLAAAGPRPGSVFVPGSIVFYHVGAYQEGEPALQQMLTVARDLRDASLVAGLLGNLGLVAAGLGRYEESREHFAEARAIAERHGLPMLIARSVSMTVGSRIDTLDLDGAAARATEANEVGASLEFSTPRVSATLDLAAIALRQNDPGTAQRLVDQLEPIVAAGTGFHGWLWRARLELTMAELTLAQGDLEGALRAGRQAADTYRRVRRRKYVLAAQAVTARALAGLGRRDEAIPLLEQALEKANAFPDPAVRLRTAAALLELSNETGARAAAEAAAAEVEAGLPAADRARFRQAVDPLLTRRV